MEKGYLICPSCGKRVEFSLGERPCQVLRGWLTVAQWKGLGAVEHHSFCSFVCLKRWVDTKVPQVPEVFLRALEERKDK